jgi:positive regulator of sigma E activity
MKDKSLKVMMMVMFGIPGVAMMVLAWLLPHLSEDRVVALFAGLMGVGVAVVLWLGMRSEQTENGVRQIPVEIEGEDGR